MPPLLPIPSPQHNAAQFAQDQAAVNVMATAAQRHLALRDYDNLRDPRDGDDLDKHRARYRQKFPFWNPRDQHLTVRGYPYLITQRVLPATFSPQ